MDGFVVRLTDRGFGFIREGTAARPGQQEWFFHRSGCRPGLFMHLQVGMPVVFTPGEDGDRGPRAEDVHIVTGETHD